MALSIPGKGGLVNRNGLGLTGFLPREPGLACQGLSLWLQFGKNQGLGRGTILSRAVQVVLAGIEKNKKM
jgi:hypothetical protein